MQRKRKRNMSYNEMYHLWNRMKLFFRILKLLTNLLIIVSIKSIVYILFIERLIYNTDLLKNTNMNRNEIIFRYISFQINDFCFYLCTFYSNNKKNDNSRKRIRSVEVIFFHLIFDFFDTSTIVISFSIHEIVSSYNPSFRIASTSTICKTYIESVSYSIRIINLNNNNNQLIS